MKIITINLWPTKGNPWVVKPPIPPHEAYIIAKAVNMLKFDGVEAPRSWLAPRYVTIAYTSFRKAAEVVEMRGGNKWKWPEGPWRSELFDVITEKLMDYYAACY